MPCMRLRPLPIRPREARLREQLHLEGEQREHQQVVAEEEAGERAYGNIAARRWGCLASGGRILL